MESTMTDAAEFRLHIQKEIEIHAPADVVFATILDQAGPGFVTPDGKSLNMKLEAWPGGRWFRDLGNNTGHLWGHVQVIKPAVLLEMCGPMMMSYPVASHVSYRLTEKNGKTLLALNHRAFGEIPKEHREGMNQGWGMIVQRIKEKSEK